MNDHRAVYWLFALFVSLGLWVIAIALLIRLVGALLSH